MTNDHRKSRRQPIRYTAWIVLEGDKKHGCVLADISDTGARLDVEDSEVLPDKFMLWLSARGKPRRPCHVVWRGPRQIGVVFEKNLLQSEAASLVPMFNADTIAAEAADEPAETD